MGKPDPCAIIEWQVWPARSRPVATALSVAVIIAAGGLAASLGGHVAYGLVSVIVLFGSLNPFFSPTSFRLDDDGVVASRWPTRKVREWTDIRTCFVDARGATLSPFTGRSVLEPYRAVRVLFAGNRDPVVAALRARLGKEVRFVEQARRGSDPEGD